MSCTISASKICGWGPSKPSSLYILLDLMPGCAHQNILFSLWVYSLLNIFLQCQYDFSKTDKNWDLYGGSSKHTPHPQDAFTSWHSTNNLHWRPQSLKYSLLENYTDIYLKFCQKMQWNPLHIYNTPPSYYWPSPTLNHSYHITIPTIWF